MNFKTFLVTIPEQFKSSIKRNRMILKATTLAFFAAMLVTMFLAAVAFSVSPKLSEWFTSLMQSERSYIAIPPPYTADLYFFIFLNNVGHFWNPIRVLVWVPLLGTFVLGLELLLNAVVIGAISVVAGITNGIFYPILALTPHGIFEIPAFILEFASLIRWHVTIIETGMAKVIGEHVDAAKLKQGIKDTIILSIASIVLFMIAAFIETYVTPHLLGL